MNSFYQSHGVMSPGENWRIPREDEVPEYIEGAKTGTNRDHGVYPRGSISDFDSGTE